MNRLEELNELVNKSLSITYYYDHWELRPYDDGMIY